MSSISIKINLRQLEHYITTTPKGTEVIVIPIERNSLFKGEKGIYLDLQAYELKEQREDSKDTHIIKQSFNDEKYKAMTDEQKKALPILGNAIYWGKVRSEPAPRGQEVKQDTFFDGEPDDMPF